MRIGIIIQARSGSTRLPDKMILPFYQGNGILENILIRIKQENINIPIILATTSKAKDDQLVQVAQKNDVPVYRGSENNVLDRFIQAANTYKIEKIIRICADNPFLDMEALKNQISSLQSSFADYWCYALNDQTPTIKTHYGFWTEGVTLDALQRVSTLTDSTLYLEHVTNFIYTNKDSFRIHFKQIPHEIEDETNIRLTIDTKQDFELAKTIYVETIRNHINFSAKELTEFIKTKPEWIEKMKKEIHKNQK